MPQQPLADRLRPRVVGDYTLSESVPENSELRRLVADPKGFVGSALVLSGPPGSGKTTLARLFASERDAEFVELTAISTGVATVREVLSEAKKRRAVYDRETILFIDEFHRFSSTQQDSLLGAVESGEILLVAATTENPSTAVNRPLLSRSRVFQLPAHSESAMAQILKRALQTEPNLEKVELATTAERRLIALCAGDARLALSVLEAAASRIAHSGLIDEAVVDASFNSVVRYDRRADQHYDTISAFIKSVRGSDADAALQYLAMMITGGEDPAFIARRLVILAAEDIGLADPQALVIATAAASAAQLVGLPEARIPLAQATIYLALAPKSNSAYLAIGRAIQAVEAVRPQIPGHLMNGSPDYIYPHDAPTAIAKQGYGNDQIFYEAKNLGFEASLVERVRALRRALGRGDSS